MFKPHTMVSLGPTITQWSNITEQLSSEVTGQHLRVRLAEGGSIPLKFQYCYWKLENGNIVYWYIPLPQGAALKTWLFDLAKNEKIDLSEFSEYSS